MYRLTYTIILLHYFEGYNCNCNYGKFSFSLKPPLSNSQLTFDLFDCWLYSSNCLLNLTCIICINYKCIKWRSNICEENVRVLSKQISTDFTQHAYCIETNDLVKT